MKYFKKILLIGVMIMSLFELSGCTDYPEIDTKAAADTALNYMESKYGQDFEVVNSKKYKIGFGEEADVYGEVRLVLKDDESVKEYSVQVYPNVDGNGYYIAMDNYICSLMEPILQSWMNEKAKNLFNNNFLGYVSSSSQANSGGSIAGFSKGFPIITNTNEVNSIIQKYGINYIYWIEIPQDEYSSDIQEDLKKMFTPYFDEGGSDLVNVRITVYSNSDFAKRKEAINNNEVAGNNYQKVREDEFILVNT